MCGDWKTTLVWYKNIEEEPEKNGEYGTQNLTDTQFNVPNITPTHTKINKQTNTNIQTCVPKRQTHRQTHTLSNTDTHHNTPYVHTKTTQT